MDKNEYGFATYIPSDVAGRKCYDDDILYDAASPISSAVEYEYFSTPVSGNLNSSVTKTFLHTNMEQAKELPSDERFEIHGFALYLTPLINSDTDGTTNVTLYKAMMNGYITLNFRSRRQRRFPITYGLSYQPSVTVGTISSVANIGSKSPFFPDRGFIPLRKPIIVGRAGGLSVKVTWPTTPNAGGTNATLLYFVFLGIREYPIAA